LIGTGLTSVNELLSLMRISPAILMLGGRLQIDRAVRRADFVVGATHGLDLATQSDGDRAELDSGIVELEHAVGRDVDAAGVGVGVRRIADRRRGKRERGVTVDLKHPQIAERDSVERRRAGDFDRAEIADRGAGDGGAIGKR
jgi:hypothetical protein